MSFMIIKKRKNILLSKEEKEQLFKFYQDKKDEEIKEKYK